MQLRRALLLAAVVAAAWPQTGLTAQSFRRGGTEFNARRTVTIAAGEIKPVMVCEFFHHGQITPDCRNVIVVSRTQKTVPTRVLQLGPGDFCRLAFETIPGQTTYEILYGGQPPEKGEVPPWTSRDGLLLETRKYKECNLNSLDSVRAAFESSERIGSDYVENVQHASDPFSLRAEPFLSHYSGQLHVGAGGKYGFLTSSRDCSFLLVDGKEVISAPGRHGPMYQAKPGSRKDIQLKAGTHRFDYYHAASGPEAMMVAAWEVNPSDPKPKPVAIPTEAFRTGSIGRFQAGTVQMREMKMSPDFVVAILGNVPLPDNDQPLVCVKFKDIGAKGLTMGGKARWEFGDGQSSSEADPVHIYLHPGLYKVTLGTGRKTAKPLEMVNRVYVDQPKLTRKDEKKFHKLDDYLPVLQTYDPAALDAAALRQLVQAYLWKADLVRTPQDSSDAAGGAAEGPGAKPAATPEEAEARRTEARKWTAKAVEAGKGAFGPGSPASDDRALLELARLVGPLARDAVGDSKLAYQLWLGAAGKVKDPEMKAECEVECAGIVINDAMRPELAKPLLEAAAKRLPERKTGPVASRLKYVWGDYFSATGDGKAARKAYLEAEELLGSTRTYLERTAWRGAHSRSTEDFLKDGELERAVAEIHQWQREFPSEKLDGYVTLLYARYWAAREMYAQAVALAEQLLTAAPDSPYADQLLVVAADCEVGRGKVDRAVATLHSILKDYPGSPLVPAVRDKLKRLESGDVPKPKRRPRSKKE